MEEYEKRKARIQKITLEEKHILEIAKEKSQIMNLIKEFKIKLHNE